MISRVKLVRKLLAWQNFAWVLMVCAYLGSSPASADVIEVGANGTTTVYSGPTMFLGNTASPVLKPETKAPDNEAVSAPSKLIEPAYPSRLHPALDVYVTQAAAKYGVDPNLVRAVAWQESRFRGSAVSPKGAIGVMQLMPGTASWLGVNPHDPRDNIFGGVAYLSTLLDRFGGDVRLALAAYNAGPEAVTRHRGIPPYRETQNYVKAISERLSIR